jgi:hypothetical protein
MMSRFAFFRALSDVIDVTMLAFISTCAIIHYGYKNILLLYYIHAGTLEAKGCRLHPRQRELDGRSQN